MEKSFIVCSYPRSRTLWLSQFLSITTVCASEHDATANAESSEQFWANAERACEQSAAPIYGDCDTAAIFVLPALLAARPMTKVLWIERPMNEVQKSMHKAGFRFGTGNAAIYKWYEKRYTPLFDYVVHYSELNNEAMMRSVWDYLVGIPFDPDWYSYMKDERIAYDAHTNPPPLAQTRVSGIFREMEKNESCMER